MVADHATGLMWQQSGSTKLLIADVAKAYADSLNKVKFAGFDDWRLPTVKEAATLIQSQKKNHRDLFIDPVFDTSQRWILTQDMDEADWPYVVYFSEGFSSSKPVGYFGAYFRLVRSL